MVVRQPSDYLVIWKITCLGTVLLVYKKGVKYMFTPVILPLSKYTFMCRLLAAALLRLNSGAGN